MPIKPENRARYPENWDEIREAILERAKNACEKCYAPNRTIVSRGEGPDEGMYMLASGAVYSAEDGQYMGMRRHSQWCHGKAVKIVLTIAHLDHIPEHCDPENLRAWCQRCHLRYDAKHHAANAAATRRARSAIADLFAEVEGAGT